MMRLLVPVLAVLLCVGCFGPDGIRIDATHPLLMTSYAYDGRGISNATGTIAIRLDADANQGTVEATARDLFHTYTLKWASFSGRAPFQSGGVASQLDMWGASGNGSAVFPKMRVYVAAFGHVESRVDGTVEKDPSNLKPTIPAILFVTQGRFRDPDTFRVDNREKLGAYDPAKPDDAYINQIGAQAVVLLFTERGELMRHFDYQDVTVRSL